MSETTAPQSTILGFPVWLGASVAAVGCVSSLCAGYTYCLAQHAGSWRDGLGPLVGAVVFLGIGLAAFLILVLEPHLQEASRVR